MPATKRNETFPKGSAKTRGLARFSEEEQPPHALPEALRQQLAALPLAEIDADGRVIFVSASGGEHWGQIEGIQVPNDILGALRTVQGDGLATLPTPFGGMRVLSTRSGDGWLLVGFSGSDSNDEAAFRGLVDDAPIALVRLEANGTPIYANHELERLTGYERGALRSYKAWLEAIHPEDRHRMTTALRLVGREGRAVTHVRFQRKDGVVRKGELHLQRASKPHEIDAVLLDVTEQDEVEAALMQNETLYQIFLEQSPVGVVHLDREGLVTFENHRLRMMTGEDADDAWIGRPLATIDRLDERLHPFVRTMLNEGEAFDEAPFVFVRQDEERRYLRVHGSPIRHPEAGIVGGALMLFDTTSEREREEELRVFRRYDQAEPPLRNAALTLASSHSFLDEAARIIGETSRADQVFVLLPDEDADAYAEEIRWTREPERSLVPLRLDVEAWPDLGSGRVIYAREELTSPEARALLDAIGGHEAVALPFVTESEQIGMLLLGRTGEAPERWSPIERRALSRLSALFETLWSWLRAEARYRQVVTTIEDGLFSFTFGRKGEREYSLATRQIEELAGHSVEALLEGRLDWLADVVHDEDRPAIEEHERALRDGRESRLVYRVLTPDGDVRWLRESATPARDRAGRMVVAGVLSDVTEAKAAEGDLVRAKQDAEAANRMKSTFLATMSHEIRTPLGAINGFAELLQEEIKELSDAPPEILEFTDAIRSSTKKVLRLVNDLFDLSRLQTGRLSVDHAPVPFHPIIARVASLAEPKCTERGLDLRLDLADSEPLVLGDAQRIEQTVEQLISNALKFTETGHIRLVTHIDADAVRLCVEDTGVGIDPEYRAELFVPFSQEDNRLNRDYEGSGLGLAIVHRLVEAMDGTLDVESVKGEGSTFTITLPRADI